MNLHGLSGTVYDLGIKPIGTGGEADIHHVSNMTNRVVEVYHNDRIYIELEYKLNIMVNRPPSATVLAQVAWLLDVLYDACKQYCGFIVPKLNITEELVEIKKYFLRKYENITIKQKIILAEKYCVFL